ncbi:hypothetical protein [Pseudoduganella violacea]|uniref:Uncharacterized protein n=1 Tax=Pseudoduganella violacea TaxID=1715466 RepID=A0A7W5FSN4_9BURK|nr:hypothetical protein [Pseudoduganella violacea]MBB3117920.1 hypothetical protein [Pseudoduganella violacea]
MEASKRKDEQMTLVVNAGLNLDILWGCVNAWAYMRSRNVPRPVALRVLSKAGPRRAADEEHPAVRDSRLAPSPIAAAPTQREAARMVARPFPLPRTNHELAGLIDHAIQLMAVRNRHYAEALLRIYSVDTPTIMRVLFDLRHRRAAGRHPRLALQLRGIAPGEDGAPRATETQHG